VHKKYWKEFIVNKENKNCSRVVLVGAGPGDPELMTLKGLKYLQKADVVIYDFLANEKLLNYCKPGAEKIYVGKKGGNHTLSQPEINQLLVDKGKKNKLIVRLKGGDPFIFGRGGEEILSLFHENIDFEVVPGITAGTAALAYAGIPATHRGDATSISFITGHEDPTKTESGLNWSAIAKMNGALVFYMGVKNLPNIVEQLTKNGKEAGTPVALVRWGTMPKQRTIQGTLANIVKITEQEKFEPPALIVIGEVIQYRDEMNWFERTPLFGKRIVVTRARAQSSDLVQQLNTLGAEVIEFPTIRIVPPESWEPLDRAIQNLHNYHWVIFTSVNGVESFQQRLTHSGFDTRKLGQIKVAAIGPATADRLQQIGLKADIQPEKFVAESLIQALNQRASIKMQNFLLPRADKARSLLKDELIKAEANVNETVAYRTIVESDHRDDIIQKLESGTVDLLTFSSSSTVENFVEILGRDQLPLLKDLTVACIGPITKKTADKFDLKTRIMPEEYSIPGLVQEILNYYKNHK
jgi:uroporphyrinogen III methyltransferase / synthase